MADDLDFSDEKQSQDFLNGFWWAIFSNPFSYIVFPQQFVTTTRYISPILSILSSFCFFFLILLNTSDSVKNYPDHCCISGDADPDIEWGSCQNPLSRINKEKQTPAYQDCLFSDKFPNVINWITISTGIWWGLMVINSMESLHEHIDKVVLNTVNEDILTLTAEFNIFGPFFYFYERCAKIKSLLCNIGCFLTWIGVGGTILWKFGIDPIVRAWICYVFGGIKNQTRGMCTDPEASINKNAEIREKYRLADPPSGTKSSNGFLYFSIAALSTGVILYIVLNRVASNKIKRAVATIKNR